MPGLKDFSTALKSSSVGRRTRARASELEDEYEPEPRSRRKGRGRSRRKGSRGAVQKQRSSVTAKQAREFGKLEDKDYAERVKKVAGGVGRIIQAARTEKGQEAIKALRAAPLSAGAVGLAIAAGLAAYGLTAYAIRKLQERKEGREQLAFDASQAYRHARMVAAEKKGRELTRPELDSLARGFKAELKKLGLTTTNLF